METINLGVGDDLPPVDWSAAVERIASGAPPDPDAHNSRTTWLTTLNEDGSPHVTAVGAIWLDGTFWFQTGACTKKHGNVERDPRCTVSVSVRDADIVLDGRATRVTDLASITRATEAWAAGGWPVEPDASGTGIIAPFNAPAQGPPPWHVYRIEPTSATVVLGIEPGGLTRFVF